ncbi:ArdC family protein [Cetobacterium sp.]|uniref:ArdC family protein n=1 Tax=Cetobacterium sp. TaxID=2071632 RepID=UPI003F393F41
MALNEKIKVERDRIAKIVIDNIKNKNGLEWLKGWIANGPQNGINSETKYKGINFLKLACDMEFRKTDDPRYMTFKQATFNGYKVKKGAVGILCEHWSFIEIEKEKREDGTIVEVEKNRVVPIVTTFHLFHASDIVGLPEFEIKELKTTKKKYKEIVNKLVETSEAKIDFKAIDSASYSKSEDLISLPPKKMFKSSEELIATLLHELAHSTGNSLRLNRDLSGAFGNESYAKEELVAEFSAIFSQIELEIDLKENHIDNHSAYLKSWINALEKNSDELYKAIGLAEKATKYIMDRYEGVEKDVIKVPLEKTESVENFNPLAV